MSLGFLVPSIQEGTQHLETLYYVHFDAAMQSKPQKDTFIILGTYIYFGYRLSAELKSEALYKLTYKASLAFGQSLEMTGGEQLMLSNTGREIFRLFNFMLSESIRRLPHVKLGECFNLALQDTLFSVSPDGIERSRALQAAHTANQRAALGRRRK